jgi:hypothetical protein
MVTCDLNPTVFTKKIKTLSLGGIRGAKVTANSQTFPLGDAGKLSNFIVDKLKGLLDPP